MTMAEPLDRPSASVPSDSSAPTPGVDQPLPRSRPNPFTAAPPVSEESSYRPLSVLALVGFVFAVLYSLLIVIITYAALKQGAPVFLGLWSFIPLLSAGLCLLAWL